MYVKICANRSIEDAKMCIEAGADFLGILVGQKYSSLDFVTKYEAKQIVDYANKYIKTVLVTHLTNADEIIDLVKYIGNDCIQLHSNISEIEVQKIVEAFPNIELIRLIHISQNGEVCSN